MPLPTGMSLQCGGPKALGKTGLGGGGGGQLAGPWRGRWRVRALEGSAARVPERCWKGFQRWKCPLEGSAARGSSAGRGVLASSSQGFQRRKGFQQGFQQVSYHPFHLHFVLFQAIVDVWPQMVQRDESVAEPQARGDSAVSVVDSVSGAWQACEVVT